MGERHRHLYSRYGNCRNRGRRSDSWHIVFVECPGRELDCRRRDYCWRSAVLFAAIVKVGLEQVAIGGLVVQVAASFFLFADASVSPVLIVLGVVLAWLYHRGILRAILRQQRELSSTQKDEFLVGARGRVMGTMEDRLTVHVQGELWTARSRRAWKVARKSW